MIFVGFEKEFFGVDTITNLPSIALWGRFPAQDLDASAYLVEARSLPFACVSEAIRSLEARIDVISKKIDDRPGLLLSDSPVMWCGNSNGEWLAKKLAPAVAANYLYGGEPDTYYRVADGFLRAGFHISFSDIRQGCNANGTTFEFCSNFDWVSIIQQLDRSFEEEIKAYHRTPGEYRVKKCGRIEYRSLPSNVDLKKVETVLTGILDP